MKITQSIYLDLLDIFEEEALRFPGETIPIFPWFPVGFTLAEHQDMYKRKTYKIKIRLECLSCKNKWTSAGGNLMMTCWLYKRPRNRPNILYEAEVFS